MTGREYNNQFSEEELVNEIWKDIPNYEGYYQASSLGRIKGLNRIVKKWNGYKTVKERVLTPVKHSDKRFKVNIGKENIHKLLYIHHLVLYTFVGPRFEDMEACHNDGNYLNNKVENLRWDTHTNNERDKIKHGTTQRGERSGNNKLSEQEVAEIRRLYTTGNYFQKDIALMFNISKGHVCQILSNKAWSWFDNNKIFDIKSVTKKRYAHISSRKFTDAQVIKMRGLYFSGKNTLSEISKIFNISRSHLRNIIYNKRRTISNCV